MTYAKINDGTVVNILTIRPEQAHEFPDCVPMPSGVHAEPGDTYADGKFYRDGVELKSTAQLQAEAEEVLNILLGGGTE